MRQLRALTALRFFAAAAIVVHHSRGWFGIPPDFGVPVTLDQGVGFFFVLSGFILTYVYPDLRRADWRRFLWARFARIWPGHAAAFLLVVLLLPAQSSNHGLPHRLSTVAANLALLHAWIPWRSLYFSYNALSWSVSTELFFYLCFPLLVAGWRRTWCLKLLGTLLVAYAMIRLGNVLALPIVETAERPSLDALVYIHPLGRIFEFTLGMATALLWRTWARHAPPTLTRATAYEASTILLLAVVVWYGPYWAAAAGRRPWIGIAGQLWLLHGGMSYIAFALLIFVLALEHGRISRMLVHPLPVWLGEISFSMYLLHQLLFRFYNLHQHAFAGLPAWLGYAFFWLLLMAASHVMWSRVERPCRSLLLRLGARPGTSATAKP